MTFGPSYRRTEAVGIPNLLTTEDDGSISRATDTGITFGTAALIQANETIGDGVYGATSGDYDAYKLQAAAGWTLTVSVDAQLLGSPLDAVVEIYNSAGALVASNDDNATMNVLTQHDAFLQFVAPSSDTYTVVVHGHRSSSQQLGDPFDSGSGPGVGSTGDYRVLINTAAAVNDPHLYRGTNGSDTINGGNGNDVFYGLDNYSGNFEGGHDTLAGSDGNDLFVWNQQVTFDQNLIDGINGGNGNDTFEADVRSGSLYMTLEAYGDTTSFLIQTGLLHFAGNTLRSVESIVIRDTYGNRDTRAPDGGREKLAISGDLFAAGVNTVQFLGSPVPDTVDASNASTSITFYGADGNDTFIPGLGNVNDDVDGGADFDTLSFNGSGSRGATVDLRINGSQDTGVAGLMTIRNFEILQGSRFADTLVGSYGDDTLNGGAGDDTLTGGGTIGSWGSRGAVDRIGDYNGDGRADLLQLNADGSVDVWTSAGTELNNFMQWTTGSRPVDQTGDFNGDGRDDLIQLYDGNNNAYVWLSNGSSFNPYSQWGTGFSSSDRVADVNGDGRDDIVQFYRGTAYVWLSNGAGFGNYTSWGTGFRSTDQFADFNGDGRADVIQLHENGTAYVWLSNGSSFGSFSAWGSSVTPSDHIADVNGDGRADIVQVSNQIAYVWLSNGTGFDNYAMWGRTGFRATDQFADFNGDGRADAIQLHENGNAYVSLSNGSSFGNFSVWGTGVTPSDRIADFDGDGRSDVIQLGANGNAYVWLSNGAGFNAYEVWGRSGVGSDTFYFTGNIGHDIVTDFHAGPGVGDIIRFDHGQLANFDAVMARTTDDANGNAVIHFDAAGNDTITLLHVSRSMLVADDFQL